MTRDHLAASIFMAATLALVAVFSVFRGGEVIGGTVEDCLHQASQLNPGAPVTVACQSF